VLTKLAVWRKGTVARRCLVWLDVALAVMVVAALSGPFVLRLYYLDIGGRALDEARAFAAAYPDAVNPALDRAIRYLQRAVAISPPDGYAYRRLGQAWLLLGANDRAVESLRRAVELRPNHRLTRIELGYAYDGLGQADQALAEYELGGYGPAVDAAIVNYLKVADWKIAAGGGNEALHLLNDRVLRLDPTNLPALYRAMHIYQGMGEQATKEFAEPMRERLRNLSSKEITLPTEPRLMAYVEQAASALVEEGLWTQEEANAVLMR
jgi:tetratricopeptide (TPR) repeat protein